MRKPKIRKYSSCAKLENSIKIVQLSDLHCNSFGKQNKGLLQAVKGEEPDLIFITGDMINKKRETTIETERFLQELAFVAPCFYCLGNHELQYKINFPEKYENFTWGLMEYGICILDNESTIASVNGTDLEIGGFSADVNAYPHFKLPGEYEVIKPESQDTIKLLLSHNPDLYKSYEKSDWDFVFSGHLHGGYIRIPGLGGVIGPNYRLFPKYSGGLYELKNNKKMLVSRGLGEHGPTFRLFNPPELTVLTINQE